MPGFEADEALFAADADIELFPDSSSPFVTRTMADLYARQGYNDQALEVYRKLAADNPDDHEIAARIRELSPAEAAPVADPSPSPDNREEVAATNEFSEPADTAEDFGFTPIGETAAIPDVESAADAPSSDVSDKSPHFSDTELGGGDEWDADSWGAGFSSEETEVVPFDLMASNDTIQLTADDASTTDHAVSQIEVTGETAAEPAEVETPFRHRADSSLIAETDRTGEFAAAEPPLGILNDARDEVQTEPHYRPFDESAVPEPSEQPAVLAERETEEPAFVAEQSQELEEPEEVKEVWRPEDEAIEDEESELTESDLTESEHFVAYSPQPPDDEDLPHYTPVGPTIREFFATLGAYRPPENGSGASYTARAAVPDIEAETQSFENSDLGTEERATSGQDETQSADEFPLVSDAFANLFPDSPVSEEDSKAAFALSGALSSQPDHPAARPVATPPSPAPPVEVQPAATQESEEDIRRFREWLDGLAES
jgi:hypothetical protein